MLLLILLLLLVLGGAFCDETRILNANELIGFSSYSGKTILLDSDLDFSGDLSRDFKPIGNDDHKYSKGVFDGQGHVISGLVMNSSHKFFGLFGISSGATIKNIVFDSSCSFTNLYSNGYPFIGSVIGYCYSEKSPCIIESIVNLASVTFNGNTNGELKLGGIVGSISHSGHETRIANCINYGDVSSFGSVKGSRTHIGGIVGDFDNGQKFIQNCLNYGNIVHASFSDNVTWLGGIVGESNKGNLTIENCVNAGVII